MEQILNGKTCKPNPSGHTANEMEQPHLRKDAILAGCIIRVFMPPRAGRYTNTG